MERCAVMYPGAQSGRGVGRAATTRIVVEDGALVLVEGSSKRILAEGGAVSQLVWLEGAQGGAIGPYQSASIVVLGASGAVISVLPVEQWSPPVEAETAVLQVITGARAVAAALGVELSTPGLDDEMSFDPKRARRRVLTSGPRPVVPRGIIGTCGVVGSVIGFASWTYAQSPVGFVLAALATILAGVHVLAMRRDHSERRVGIALIDAQRPGGIRPADGGALSLSIGAEVWLSEGTSAVVVPGASAGGVRRAEVGMMETHLQDEEGRSYLVLDTAAWAGDRERTSLDRWKRRLRRAGLEVTDAREVRAGASLLGGRHGRALVSYDQAPGMQPGNLGMLGTYAGLWALGLASTGALVSLSWSVPAGSVLVGVVGGLWVGRWRWRDVLSMG